MIEARKLKGQAIWVNPDLIALVESPHGSRDTVLTLADGRHVIVADAADVIAERVRRERAEVLAMAFALDRAAGGGRPDERADDPPADGTRWLRSLPTATDEER